MSTENSLHNAVKGFFWDLDRLKEQTRKISEDKQKIKKLTETYNTKYEEKIAEGTLKKQLLLENGRKRGLTEEETLTEYGKFLPSVQTPILNFLFFFMEDEGNMQEFLTDSGDFISSDKFENKKNELNTKYGLLTEDYYTDDKAGSNVEAPNWDEVMYGNMTYDIFKKIKKLKALSKSDNPNEAFEAYSMCMKFCKKYDLDFDKIPCASEKRGI